MQIRSSDLSPPKLTTLLPFSNFPRMAKKISGGKTCAAGRAGNLLPAEMESDTATGAHGVTRPTKLKPSALLDTRVV